jgi:cardiolipin synthase
MGATMDVRDATSTAESPLAPTASALPAAEAERFDGAFSRATGAALTEGNAVRLLVDAHENFPAWLDAIRNAQRYVLFESYIIADDRVGREFVEALAAKARDGVRVCVVYDWLGSTKWKAPWADLHAAGAEVHCFNPPSFASPLAWLARDHRKSIVVDGEIGFVSGLCVNDAWLGNPAKRHEPWRDTGVEIRGPALIEIENAFTQVWSVCGGTPLAFERPVVPTVAGNVRVRVIAGVPNAAGTYRTDLLVASLARQHLWLSDAYFVATAPYMQALRAAARDGVDVRLLVPGASDIPAVSPLSRIGYRPLLEAGVRVFEWDGTMMHAKTAVADNLWSRVGSTNLNFASWVTNYELDVAIEDPAFAVKMATQFERDLGHATEIVLTRNRVRRTEPRPAPGGGAAGVRRAMIGSAGRAAAGAVSVGSALGAALTNRRTLGPTEAGLLTVVAIVMVVIAIVGALFPRVLAWPIALFGAWFGLAWGWKAWTLWQRKGSTEPARERAERPAAPPASGT